MFFLKGYFALRYCSYTKQDAVCMYEFAQETRDKAEYFLRYGWIEQKAMKDIDASLAAPLGRH